MSNIPTNKKYISRWYWILIIIMIASLLLLGQGFYAIEFRDKKADLADNEFSESLNGNADYVYMIIVDGLRADFLEKMPYVKSLAEEGASGIMTVPEPTFSRPAYARIITGASSSIIGINSNFQTQKLATPTIYDMAKALGLKTGISAYYWYYELTTAKPYEKNVTDKSKTVNDLNHPIQNAYYYYDYSSAEVDAEIFTRGMNIMLEHSPNLMIVHSMDVDTLGHWHGVSTEYENAVALNDLYIKNFVEAIPHPDRSVVIVTGDHGHIDQGGHGGPEREAMEVPFVIFGKDVIKGNIDGYTQLDIAPTISAILGLPFTAYMEGQVIDKAFTWPEDEKERMQNIIKDIHRPFVEKLYNSFDVPFTAGETISIEELNDTVQGISVKIKFTILAALIVVALVLSGLFNRRQRIEEELAGPGPDWSLIFGATVAIALYFSVHQLLFRMFGLSYSYSVIGPDIRFISGIFIPTILGFTVFFLVFLAWGYKRKSGFVDYSIFSGYLLTTLAILISLGLILQGGAGIFLPRFTFLLLYLVSLFQLLLTSLLVLLGGKIVLGREEAFNKVNLSA